MYVVGSPVDSRRATETRWNRRVRAPLAAAAAAASRPSGSRRADRRRSSWVLSWAVREMASLAGSSASFPRAPTMLEQLLEEINFQRTKEMRQLLKDGGSHRSCSSSLVLTLSLVYTPVYTSLALGDIACVCFVPADLPIAATFQSSPPLPLYRSSLMLETLAIVNHSLLKLILIALNRVCVCF